MRKTLPRLIIVTALISICIPLSLFAYVAASGSYRIESDSMNFGGGLGSSASYQSENTLGEVGTGRQNSSLYYLNAGYQQHTLTVSQSCNDNGICEGSETISNCAADCQESSSGGPIPSPSCTDPLASNYGANGACIYAVPGCMNPAALNYLSSATTDNGSCRFIYGASGFSASGNAEAHTASLHWSNPSNQTGFTFDRVRIVRKTSLPGGPSDGTVVYEGGGTSATDSGLSLDIRYYYAAYVYSAAGDVSGAAVTSVLLSASEGSEEPPEEGEEGTSPGEDGGTDGGGGAGTEGGTGSGGSSAPTPPFDVFETFPNAKLEIKGPVFAVQVIQQDSIKNFIGGDIRVRGDQSITFSLDYNLLPEALKTIGITIFDPENNANTASFILHADRVSGAYRTTIGTFTKPGRYPMVLHIFNHEDQQMKKIYGTLVVRESLPVEILSVTTRVVAPVAVGTGVAVGALESFFIASQVNSLYDVYLLILRFFGALLGIVGLRKRKLPWGTVYDSVTKRPLDPAYVSALRWTKEYRSVITDIDGRYGFFLPPGSYTLIANKTHYSFPSKRLAGESHDQFYNNLYFGEEIFVNEGEVISRNIPMDPIGFDWNEFMKDKAGFMKFHSRRELVRTRIFNAVYIIGFVTACITLLVQPAVFNIAAVAIYVGITSATVYWRGRHKVVAVRNAVTHEPIPFAIIRFKVPDLDQEIKRIVADELGRFYQLLRPGDYVVTVEEPQADGTYKKLYTSPPIHMPTGILLHDLEFVPTET